MEQPGLQVEQVWLSEECGSSQGESASLISQHPRRTKWSRPSHPSVRVPESDDLLCQDTKFLVKDRN